MMNIKKEKLSTRLLAVLLVIVMITGILSSQYNFTIVAAFDELPTGIVSGTVKEAGTDHPMDGAIIEIGGFANSSATTLSDGTYSISELYVDEIYTITASAEGFEAETKTVVFGSEIDFKLKKLNTGFAFANENPDFVIYGQNANLFTNTASGGGGIGDITYEITGDAATINTSTGEVAILKAGIATIQASKAADEAYSSISATYTLTINKALQTGLSFATVAPEDIEITELTYSNIASGAVSGSAITYSIESGDDAATINGDTGELTFVKAGSVVVKATAATNEYYEEATASYSLTIVKINQTDFEFETSNPSDITFSVDGTYINTASGGQSGGAISYEITGDAATIHASTGEITLLKAGTVTVTATLQGNDQYQSITAAYSIKINKANQEALVFDVTSPAEIIYSAGKTYTNIADGGSGMGDITYTVISGDAATIATFTGELSIWKSGTVTIMATKAADLQYSAATATYSITINKADQTGFVFTTLVPEDIRVKTMKYTNKATGGQSGGMITYQIINGNAATINGDTGELTLVKTGSIIVQAILDGNDKYKEVTTTYNLTIIKSHQTNFAFATTNPSNLTYSVNGTYTNIASGGESGETVTYEITSGDAATINEETGILTLIKSGMVTVLATLEGDEFYEPITATYSITIDKAEQTEFVFDKANPSNIVYNVGGTFMNSAGGGQSNEIVTYEIISGDAATIDVNTAMLTIQKAGAVEVKATLPGNDCYNTAFVTYSLIIQKAEQTGFTFGEATPANLIYNSLENEYTNIASGGQSGEVISYALIEGDAVTLDTVTGLLMINKAGTISVRATLPGNDCYNTAIVTYSLTIDKAEQTGFVFDVVEPANVIYNNDNNQFTNTASGGVSGETVSYAIILGDAVSVNASTGLLTIKKAGTVTVRATLPGNDCYKTIDTTYALTIEKDNQVITFDTISTQAAPISIIYGNNFSNACSEIVDLTAADGVGYGTEVIFYSIVEDNSEVLQNISQNGVLTFNNQKVGAVTIKATKGGDDCYNETETTYYLTVDYLVTPEQPYVLSGVKINESGWHTGDVTITAKTGYEISDSNALTDNIWADKLVIETEGSKAITVYLRMLSAHGYDITANIDISDTDIMIDKNDPTDLGISYSLSILNTVLETISFGFFKASVTVTLTATDVTSGIDTFEWTYTQQSATSTTKNVASETNIIGATEIVYEDSVAKASFTLSADEAKQYRGSIYYTATDKSGRTTEKFDKKVIVVDSIAPVVTISYSGDLIQKVDVNNSTVMLVESNTRYIYKSSIIANIEVIDANFFESNNAAANNDINISVKRDGVVVTDCKISDWTHTEGTDKYIRSIHLATDGDYIIEVKYDDKSGNEMQYTSVPDYKSGRYHYTSNVLTIDTVAPIVSVSYDSYKTGENADYYNTDRRSTIQIIERNFRASDVNDVTTARDIQGNIVSHSGATSLREQSKWTEVSNDVWETSFTYREDAIYTFDIDYQDLANNKASDYTESRFTIDKTKPDTKTFKINYSTPLLEKVIQIVSFDNYKPSVTVTMQADDPTSGIDYFVWTYTQEKGTSIAKNVASETNRIIKSNIKYSNKDLTATASFTLTADEAKQYRGGISFNAADMAGNISSEKADAEKVVIVDTISPTRIVEISPAQQVVDRDTLIAKDSYSYTSEGTNSILYYNGEVTVVCKIVEANFYAEDVKINVNGKEEKPGNWSRNGDEWTSSFKLFGEGDYIIDMTYSDRSANEMIPYTSEKIVIDKIAPAIKVVYSPNYISKEANGRLYYDTIQTASITVTEHNFRADDILATVTAKDVTGADVAVTNYTKYLKTRSNWTKNGDVYTATIRYSVDANYTFDISYTDLATNIAKNHSEDLFTVDTTAPTNLTISFSNNIFETIMEAITFGYYNDQMTVTITAEDTTSGIRNFVYNYIKSEGVSAVNAERLNAAIEKADIRYSKEGKVATASFTISNTVLTKNNQFNGTVLFTAKDRSNNNTEKKEAERIVVDNITPTATVSHNEPAQNINGISYYSGKINTTIVISEANFYAEDVTVLVSKDDGAEYTVKPSWDNRNVNVHTGTITIEGDGDYLITVTYKDRSNNEMATYKTNQLTIDTTKPSITVDNIANASASKEDKIGFVITAKDTNLDPARFVPKLECIIMDENGTFTTLEVTVDAITTIIKGQEYSYTIDNLDTDGIYSLSCTVTDKSGNATSDIIISKSDSEVKPTLSFSVNRGGSTFALDGMTDEIVSTYYVNDITNNIIIEETNVNPLSSYKLTLNGKELVEGTEYTVEHIGGNADWYKYTYAVNPSLFKEEGLYTVVVSTTDKAKNLAYSDIKNAEISFVVDKTAPVLSISGLENGGRYQVESQTVTVIPKDDGGKLYNFNAIATDKEGKAITDESGNDISVRVDLSGDKLLEALENNSNKIVFDIPSGMEINMKIICNDLSVDSEGNRNTTEMVFTNITVSPDWYIILYANKPVFYATIAGIIVFIAALSAFIILRKKKKIKIVL